MGLLQLPLVGILMLGFGAAIGALIRWGVQQWLGPYVSHWGFWSVLPVATLLVNIMGALVLGLLMGFAHQQPQAISKAYRLAIGTGFCGGLTTFSTFSLELMQLIQQGHMVLAWLYLILSVSLCLLAVFLGWKLGISIGGF